MSATNAGPVTEQADFPLLVPHSEALFQVRAGLPVNRATGHSELSLLYAIKLLQDAMQDVEDNETVSAKIWAARNLIEQAIAGYDAARVHG